jgi:hypothetical protein
MLQASPARGVHWMRCAWGGEWGVRWLGIDERQAPVVEHVLRVLEVLFLLVLLQLLGCQAQLLQPGDQVRVGMLHVQIERQRVEEGALRQEDALHQGLQHHVLGGGKGAQHAGRQHESF